MDGRQIDGTAGDSALDREIESALGIEPSPEFVARVRTRIAAEPRSLRSALHPRAWLTALHASAWLPAWDARRVFDPLLAVGIVGIVLAILVPQWVRRDGPDHIAVVDARRTDIRLDGVTQAAGIAAPKPEAPTEVAPATTAEPSMRVVAARDIDPAEAVGPDAPPRLSTPLFSPDDQRALLLLVTVVAEGRMPPRPEGLPPAETPGHIGLLAIEPLVIAPLPQLARGGEAGGTQW